MAEVLKILKPFNYNIINPWSGTPWSETLNEDGRHSAQTQNAASEQGMFRDTSATTPRLRRLSIVNIKKHRHKFAVSCKNVAGRRKGEGANKRVHNTHEFIFLYEYVKDNGNEGKVHTAHQKHEKKTKYKNVVNSIHCPSSNRPVLVLSVAVCSFVQLGKQS